MLHWSKNLQFNGSQPLPFCMFFGTKPCLFFFYKIRNWFFIWRIFFINLWVKNKSEVFVTRHHRNNQSINQYTICASVRYENVDQYKQTNQAKSTNECNFRQIWHEAKCQSINKAISQQSTPNQLKWRSNWCSANIFFNQPINQLSDRRGERLHSKVLLTSTGSYVQKLLFCGVNQ